MLDIGIIVENSVSYRKQIQSISALLYEHGLTYPQLECLYTIDKKEQAQNGQLSKSLCRKRSSISRILSELDNKDLISYTHDYLDRRKVFVSAYKQGKSLLYSIKRLNLNQE